MSDSGLYVVAMTMPTSGTVTVGRLGRFRFEKGLYLYTGSAQRNLAARVARHAKRTKSKRWQIDYLRAVCRWEFSTLWVGVQEECALARSVAEVVEGEVAPKRFGASDCRCAGHLVHTLLSPEEAQERLALISAG